MDPSIRSPARLIIVGILIVPAYLALVAIALLLLLVLGSTIEPGLRNLSIGMRHFRV